MLLYKSRLSGLKEDMQVYIRNHPAGHGRLFTFDLTGDKISDHHFEWEKKGKEFFYNGKLYDVAGMHRSGNKLFVHAYNDRQEEQLLGQLKLQHQQKDNAALTELILLVFISPSSSFGLQPEPPILEHSPGHFLSVQPSIVLGVQSPPPDLV
jgi:hypothetical protein